MASIFNKIDLINNDNTYSTLRMSNYGSVNSVLTSNGNGTSDWADIYLQKSGGTMTGNIEMNDSAVKSTFIPNADDVLTNKLYVDSAVDNINISSANKQFSTGLISGGKIIQNNGTTFNINAGIANINDINGNNTVLTWEEFIAQPILSSISTFVWINSSGEVVKSSTPPANSLLRSVIYLGVVNSNGISITDIDLHPSCVIHTNNSLMDFCFAIGHINLSGNNITKDPTTNLGLSKSSGNIFAYGSNFANNINDPHVLFLTNLVTSGINYYMQNGDVSADLVVVNPNVLDTGTDYPSSSVDSNKWTIQRIYSSSSSNNRLRIIPGQFQYSNRQNAINAMATEIITPNAFVIAHSCILCLMVIKQGITVLNTGTNVLFYPQHNQLGGGSSVVSQTVLTDIGTAGSASVLDGVLPYYNIKGIKANSGLSLSSNSTDITLTNSSPASGITLSTVGTGTSLTSSTANPDFSLKSLTAGTGINFTGSTSTDVIINSVSCNMGWSNYYEYNFSTIITDSPLNGQIRFNDTSFNATHIYVSHINSLAVDIDFYLDQITTGDILYFQNKDSSIQWVKFKVTGYTNYTNNYRDFFVEYQNSEGLYFTDNQNIIFTSYINTAGINTRLNVLDDKTQYQTTALDQTNFAGTLYADYVKVNGGTSESYLMADGSLSPAVQLNNGGLGTSLVKNGTGYVLELNSISAFSGVGLVLNNNNISLSNTLPSTLITFGTSGSGSSLIKSNINPDLVLKGLDVGAGLSISTTTDLITLTNTTEASTLSNVGAGSSLIVSGSAPSLTVKSISASTGISITDASNNLQITNSSPASDITFSSVGTGTTLTSSTTNPNFSVKSISASTGISITDASNNLQITNSSPASGITFSNSGTGTTLTSSTTNPNFSVKSISASVGISITDASNNLQITNSSPASGITFSNSGTGTTLTSSTTNPNFSVKSISASTGISITDASNNLQITNSSPASDITFSSVGTGTTLTSSTTNPNFSFKSLTAGTGINFTGSTSTDLVINSTGGGGGTYTFANAGTGTTLVASTSGINDFKTCSITAGSNVSLSSIGNDITISASGSSGTNTVNWTAVAANTNYRLGGQSLTGAQALVNFNASFYFNPSVSNTYGASCLFAPNISLTGQITAPGGFVGNASSATLINITTTSTNTNYELLGVNGVTPPLAAQRNASFYFNPSASNTYGVSALFAPNISLTGKITAPGGFIGNASSATTILTTAVADNFSYNILGTTVASGQTTPSLNSSFYFNPSTTGGQKLFVPNIDCSTGTITAANFTGTASQSTLIGITSISDNVNYNLLGVNGILAFLPAFRNSSFYYNPSSANPYGASCLFAPNISLTGQITAPGGFVGNASSATLINITTTSANTNYELLGVNGVSPPLAAQRSANFYFNPSTSNPYGAACLFTPNISSSGSITATGGFIGNASSSTTHLINTTIANSSFNILGTTAATGQTTPSVNTSFYFNPSTTGGQKLFVPNIDCSTGTVTAGNFTGLASRATAINTTLVSASTNYNIVGISATTGFNGANVNTGFYFNPSASNTYGASALFVPNISCGGSITATSFIGNASTATTSTKTNNITGGLGGQLLFQSALDTTSKLANGTAEQILLSAGTTANPVWTTGSIKGWSVSFGGLGGISGYLQPNRFYDATATLNTTSNQATRYIMPESATITKLSTLVQTISTTAQFRIITGTYASPSVKFTSTANTQFAATSGILTLALPIVVAAGEVVEVQITALVGTCMINLYFT